MNAHCIYRILLDTEWRELLASDQYSGNSLDERDGFIHLSTRAQVPGTLAAHFNNVSDEIIRILEIDASVLRDALRWERSREGMLFPHLYGPLPLRAVIRTMTPDQFSGGSGHSIHTT